MSANIAQFRHEEYAEAGGQHEMGGRAAAGQEEEVLTRLAGETVLHEVSLHDLYVRCTTPWTQLSHPPRRKKI